MKIKILFHTLVFLLAFQVWSQAKKEGALILLSKQGEVSFLDAAGATTEAVKVGDLIPRSYTATTGVGSEMTILLTNGTLITLVEKTRMKLKTFEQEPFDPRGRKVKDLEVEPSSSEVGIELDAGSLIIKTKKLNKSSSFDIYSPLGTAGIRGTEFQMALDPAQGVQLDVTESTVAFTPPGGGQPIAVSEGSGLSVSPSGAVTQRPVSPTAAQQISTTNESATIQSENVSLNEVTNAMEQATTEAETAVEESPEPQEDSPEEPMEEDSQPETEEEAPMEESGEGAEPAESDDPTSEPSEETAPMEESSEPAAAEVEETEPQAAESEPQADAGTSEGGEGGSTNESTETTSTSSPASETEVSEGESGGQASSPSGESSMETAPTNESTETASTAAPVAEPEVSGGETGGQASSPVAESSINSGAFNDAPPAESSTFSSLETVSAASVGGEASMDQGAVQNAALENNSEISMARKTGIVDEYTQTLAKLGLSEDQTLRFYDLSDDAKVKILGEENQNAARLLKADGFGKETADLYFSYSPTTREKILGLEDQAMVALINQQIEEGLLAESLTKMNLDLSNSANVPAAPITPDPLEARKLALGEALIEHGNEKLMDELTSLSGGVLTEDWLEVGELAARILEDQSLGGAVVPGTISSVEVFGNSFYSELADLYQQLQLDSLVSGDSPVIATKNLVVQGNAQALAPYFGDGASSLILAAAENLDISVDLDWGTTSQANTRLVVMGAGEVRIQPGTNLNSVTSDLVISSRDHLTIEEVKLEVAQELAIRSLRDVELKNLTLGADALTTIKARRDLNVDGLSFNRDVSRIVMEATTMRLSNVDFPALSTVQLNSLKGGIEGRYPNFGSAISPADQIGRVNFIENIKSGGNLIMNRATFDQFGQNINIGKIVRP